MKNSSNRFFQTTNCKLATLQCGFTQLELVIAIIAVLVLTGVFLNRFLFYQEQAEKVAMEGVAGVLQSALTLQYGQIMTRGKPSDVAALARDNPMNWLQKRPRNYAGEFFVPTPDSVAAGSWLFDLKSRELIYIVRNRAHFTPGRDGRPWIRFHVVTRPPESLSSSQALMPELAGARFEPVAPYAWF